MATKSLELRKLMKQQKSSNSKKINHPLAKYNNLDQLLCIICNSVIKNEVIWTAHLQSKKHKENVVKLKAAPTKTKTTTNVTNNAPPLKGILKKNESSETKTKQKVPTDFFDETSEEIPSDSGMVKKVEAKQELPSDFFDGNQATTDIASESNKQNTGDPASRKRKASSTSEQLPEGFFDDPKQDAKARNIEYKDPKDAEWEKFQKMIQEETKIAENIQDEEDEESEMLKDLTELNTMKSCLSRVENLKKVMRKTNQEKKQKSQPVDEVKMSPDQEDENFSDGDEEDFEKLFDWRSKTA